MMAEASAEAIRRVNKAMGDNPTAMTFLLGEKYIMAMQELGQSQNAKMVILPADLQEAVRGLFGKMSGR